ncbi:MAG: type I-C CRISPR-associated endonuclease Cas1 [Myxococcales bacterium]|nr:type I-C CRISPR-associated endonuclease Cas1 [Myxococcales bacterium]
MKRLLNTLYVTTEGAYLRRDGETVLVRVAKETRLRVPIHTLGAIVCFGRVGASPQLMGLCGERGVAISFMSPRGRFYARVVGPVSGNVLLRRAQYRVADDEEASAAIAAAAVTGKIANARAVLQRALRDRPDCEGREDLERATRRLARLVADAAGQRSLDAVRGIEGDAANHYFGCFNHLITADEDAFRYERRSRRPPLDPLNALLSFLYTLLFHDAAAALEGVGLDPAVGFLHRDRPGRRSLALDLMEELRPVLADRVALSLVNRRQVRAEGFRTTESGAVLMDDETRKTVLATYQKRKQEELLHPFVDERVPAGLLPHVQAMLLARHLRGDLDGYPPFLWK